jgi:hypothetical protein
MKCSSAFKLMCVLSLGNSALSQQAIGNPPAVPSSHSVAPVPAQAAATTSQTDQTKTAAITNADVIQMASLGVSDDVIIDKIYATKSTGFDTSVTGLTALKTAKVSDAVIRVMINPQTTPVGANGAPLGSPPMAPPNHFNLPTARPASSSLTTQSTSSLPFPATQAHLTRSRATIPGPRRFKRIP